MSAHLVFVDGLMGAGKSTICQDLATALPDQIEQVSESINPVFLDLMLKSPADLFAFQMSTLSVKVERVKWALMYSRATGKTMLIDRGIVGDYVFALLCYEKGFITEPQWAAYMSVLNQVPPELLAMRTDVPVSASTDRIVSLFVEVTPQTAIDRVRARGHSGEIGKYTLGYFAEIEKKHQELFDFSRVVSIQSEAQIKVVDGHLSADTVNGLLSLLQLV